MYWQKVGNNTELADTIESLRDLYLEFGQTELALDFERQLDVGNY